MSAIAARNLWMNNHDGALPPIKGGGGASTRPGVRGNSASPSSRSSNNEGDDNRPKGQKPQLLVCYLCGQQFGSSSLQIHLPQCYSKKTIDWERAEPGKRGPRPRDPATVDLSAMPKNRDEFNNQQFSQFTENLAQCPNCGRKFLADRLEVHLRSCKAGSAGASKPIKGKEFTPGNVGGGGGGGYGDRAQSASNRKNRDEDEDDGGDRRKKGQKPQLLVCYLCGQQFGSSSLQIHLPQCYSKKTIDWERAEPGKRGPRPRDPATVDLSAMPKNRDEFNNQQFSQFTENLAQCPNCGRKFLADRLEVHLRSCKSGSAGASKPIKGKEFAPRPGTTGGSGGGGGGGSKMRNDDDDDDGDTQKRQKGIKPMFLVCYLCGQQFGTSSLEIHVPQCYVKKIIDWERADPTKRGPRPKDPATVDLSAMPKSREEFNNQQFSHFTENLAPCPNCGRKFLADRLEVHLRSCKAGSAGASKPIKGKELSSATARPQSSSAPSSDPYAGRPSTSSGPSGGGGGGGAPKQSSAPSVQPKKSSVPASPIPTRLPPKLRALKKLIVDEIAETGRSGRTVDVDELYDILDQIEPGISQKDADSIMSSLDINNDGVVDAGEWSRAAQDTAKDTSANPLRNRLPSTSPANNNNNNNKNGGGSAAGGVGLFAFCDDCGEKLPKSSKFCSRCGAQQGLDDEPNDDDLNDEEQDAPASLGKLCEECGEVFSDETKFCEECGGELKSLVPQQHSQSMLRMTNQQNNTGYNDNEEDDEDDQYDDDDARPPQGSSSRPSGSAPARNNNNNNNNYSSKQQQQQQPPQRKQQQNNNNPYNDGDEEEEFFDAGDRAECTICGRKFAPESIAKHEKICQKVSSKQRKVFDSSKMRQTGEMKQVTKSYGGGGGGKGGVNTARGSAEAKKDPNDIPKWKRESLQFRNAMKQARDVSDILAKGGTAKDLPPPTYSENAHYKACPHCGRKFAPDTAERHIPKCATTMNRPKPPPRRR